MVQEQIQRKRNDTKAILLTKLFKLMDKIEMEKIVKPHLLNFLIKALQSIGTEELHTGCSFETDILYLLIRKLRRHLMKPKIFSDVLRNYTFDNLTLKQFPDNF
jgi:hypothetical protein